MLFAIKSQVLASNFQVTSNKTRQVTRKAIIFKEVLEIASTRFQQAKYKYKFLLLVQGKSSNKYH